MDTDVSALINLGCLYQFGKGVEKDEAEAFRLFTLAAEKGHRIAYNNLGECYENAHGVEKDLQKAKYWYKKAAIKGYKKAAEKLKRSPFNE